MALKRPPSDCVEHTIEINNIKKDMETLVRHEIKFNETVDRIESTIDRLSESIFKINLTLESFNELPKSVRKLEDKSIVMELIKSFGWFVIGALIMGYVGQLFIANSKDKTEYKIERTK